MIHKYMNILMKNNGALEIFALMISKTEHINKI